MTKTGHESDNFYDIKKPLRILLADLIIRKCAKFQVEMKIVWVMLPADLKNDFTVLKKTRRGRYFEKKLQKNLFMHFKILTIFGEISWFFFLA